MSADGAPTLHPSAERPLRVALLVTDLEWGGTPLRIARTARRLSAAGVDVSVGCLAPLGPVGRALQGSSIHTFCGQARSRFDLATVPRILRSLCSVEPDVIHATLTHANVIARIIGTVLRIPVVGSTATTEPRAAMRLLELCTAQADTAHVVNSAVLRRFVIDTFRVPESRAVCVPPLIEVPDPMPLNDARAQLGLAHRDETGGRVVLYVGRLDPWKRVDRIIAAAGALESKDHLLIVGDGPQRPALERLAQRCKAAVHFAGWQSDLSLYYAAADCLVLASEAEGLPNVALEARSVGLPVVGPPLETLAGIKGVDVADVEDAASFAHAMLSAADRGRSEPDLNLRASDPTAALIAIYAKVVREQLRT